MRNTLFIASVTAGLALGGAAFADGHGDAGYSALDLLSPCQEADNDARWGETAETECEQYIMGFVGALQATGAGKAAGVCPPDVNTADEVRWAFMRWVHQSYAKRTKMTAPDALMGTLSDHFACK